MAVVTSDLLLLTLAGLRTEFDGAYQKAQENPDWRLVATELETTLPSQDWVYLGHGAVMRQFTDEAEDQSVNSTKYTLSDIIYKGRLKIQRKMLEDDQYSLLMKRVRAMAQEPVRHWNQLAYQGLVNGFTTKGPDGQNFFASTHAESGTNQSNTTTNTLSDANLETAVVAMMAYQNDKGLPMEIKPDTLVVGPKLSRRAWNLIAQDVVVKLPGDGTAGSGATAYTPYGNYFNGRFKLVVNPYITGFQWFLMDTSREVLPILMQSRSDVPITLESDMDQPMARMQEEYRFDARGRYVQGYGLWQTCYGSNASS